MTLVAVSTYPGQHLNKSKEGKERPVHLLIYYTNGCVVKKSEYFRDSAFDPSRIVIRGKMTQIKIIDNHILLNKLALDMKCGHFE